MQGVVLFLSLNYAIVELSDVEIGRFSASLPHTEAACSVCWNFCDDLVLCSGFAASHSEYRRARENAYYAMDCWEAWVLLTKAKWCHEFDDGINGAAYAALGYLERLKGRIGPERYRVGTMPLPWD